MHDIDDDDGVSLPWFTMPRTDDEAAVAAWLAAVELANIEAGERLAATLDECGDLMADIASLLGAMRGRGPVC